MNNVNENKESDKSGDEDNCAPEITYNFQKVMKDFLNDILTTFPEYEQTIKSSSGCVDILNDDFNTENTIELHNYVCGVFPERFFDLVYEREEIFDDDDVNTLFLPGIDFSILWKQNISDNTKSTIWNYLKLILFNISGDIKDGAGFGDTAKLFEAIDENELKTKLEETLKDMSKMFNIGDMENDSFEGMGDLSGVESLFEGMGEGVFYMRLI